MTKNYSFCLRHVVVAIFLPFLFFLSQGLMMSCATHDATYTYQLCEECANGSTVTALECTVDCVVTEYHVGDGAENAACDYACSDDITGDFQTETMHIDSDLSDDISTCLCDEALVEAYCGIADDSVECD